MERERERERERESARGERCSASSSPSRRPPAGAGYGQASRRCAPAMWASHPPRAPHPAASSGQWQIARRFSMRSITGCVSRASPPSSPRRRPGSCSSTCETTSASGRSSAGSLHARGSYSRRGSAPRRVLLARCSARRPPPKSFP